MHVVLVRRMDGNFGGRQAKDQPSVAHIHVRQLEHVAKEGTVPIGTRAVNDRMRANDHGCFPNMCLVDKRPRPLHRRLSRGLAGMDVSYFTLVNATSSPFSSVRVIRPSPKATLNFLGALPQRPSVISIRSFARNLYSPL